MRVTAPCPIYGFIAKYELVSQLDEAEETALTDSFLELLEARGLVSSGGFNGTRWSHVVRSEASQATDADRVAVHDWATSRAEIRDGVCGPIVDLESAFA